MPDNIFATDRVKQSCFLISEWYGRAGDGVDWKNVRVMIQSPPPYDSASIGSIE